MKERAYNKYALSIKRPHLVLLGAGASLAAFPNGEKNGMEMPLMNNFVETVDGLSDYLNKYGIDYRGNNFDRFIMELVLEYRVIEFGIDYLRKALTKVPINGTKLQLSREKQFDSFFKG